MSTHEYNETMLERLYLGHTHTHTHTHIHKSARMRLRVLGTLFGRHDDSQYYRTAREEARGAE